MLTAVYPLILALIGAAIYILSTNNTKLAELGRLLFLAGSLALALELAGRSFSV